MRKVLIIGAGGIGSFLIPLLDKVELLTQGIFGIRDNLNNENIEH